MKFLAVYTSKEAIETGKCAMLRLLEWDDFYPMHNKLFGTGQVYTAPNDSRYYWEKNGKNVVELELNEMNGQSVAWHSCGGNSIAYQHTYINGVECMLVCIKSRRHGIPCSAMKGFEPSEVIYYKSSAEWWGPFDTLDDHPNDKELFEPPSEWEDGDEYSDPKKERMSRF